MTSPYANPGISNAANPSRFGYHHGPIPNPNDGWVPDGMNPACASHMLNTNSIDAEVREAHDAGRAYTVTTEMNANAPNPASNLSSINTGVCDIVVDAATGAMCGTVTASQPAQRRHIRTAHAGAVTNRPRVNTTVAEEAAGKTAIQNWVRSGGWRHANYIREPGVGPEGGLIHTYADGMEELARNDANFAATYGTHFHRPRLRPPSSRKRKNRGGPPREESPPSPSPAPPRKKATPRKKGKAPASSSRVLRSARPAQEEIKFENPNEI
ncbi:uncharacterized protein ColSpa_06163 [Colletotrichum spaethianum]|uniref:Uncharacterized protein n=1 Tax=Colletotrichum spaethianum TaxID=700344 RepID=A0AA37NY90_9PEZI|nr:uncharacterized protein ColSpa_06163 [Colletotrichum spaethianum]GKT45982.1 hypothetical protein ColSpa_06163 [Colletotrichum spaethianum]